MVRKWSIEDFKHLNVQERVDLIDALTEGIEKSQDGSMDGASDWEEQATRILGKKPGTLRFRSMSVDELFEFIGDICNSIPENEWPPLTKEQEEELERRIEAHRQNPSEVLSWEEVKADALRRLRKAE